MTNNGPSTAKDVRVSDPLPGRHDVRLGDACGLRPRGDGRTCALGDLARGQSVTITLVSGIPPALAKKTRTNEATVSSPTPDPNLGEQQGLGDRHDHGRAAVEAARAQDRHARRRSSPVRTVDVHDRAEGAVEGGCEEVDVCDTLPAALVFESAAGRHVQQGPRVLAPRARQGRLDDGRSRSPPRSTATPRPASSRTSSSRRPATPARSRARAGQDHAGRGGVKGRISARHRLAGTERVSCRGRRCRARQDSRYALSKRAPMKVHRTRSPHRVAARGPRAARQRARCSGPAGLAHAVRSAAAVLRADAGGRMHERSRPRERPRRRGQRRRPQRLRRRRAPRSPPSSATPRPARLAQPAGRARLRLVVGRRAAVMHSGSAASPRSRSPRTAVTSTPCRRSRTRSPASRATSRPARSTQLKGAAGCVRPGGLGGCASGVGLLGATSLAIAPDGRSLYVAGRDADAVASFSIDPTGGALLQLGGKPGVHARRRDAGACTLGPRAGGRRRARDLARRRDALCRRQGRRRRLRSCSATRTTGALTQQPGPTGCIRLAGGLGCTTGRALGAALGARDRPGRARRLRRLGLGQRRLDPAARSGHGHCSCSPPASRAASARASPTARAAPLLTRPAALAIGADGTSLTVATAGDGAILTLQPRRRDRRAHGRTRRPPAASRRPPRPAARRSRSSARRRRSRSRPAGDALYARRQRRPVAFARQAPPTLSHARAARGRGRVDADPAAMHRSERRRAHLRDRLEGRRTARCWRVKGASVDLPAEARLQGSRRVRRHRRRRLRRATTTATITVRVTRDGTGPVVRLAAGPLKVRAGTARATIGCDARTRGGCTGVAILRLGGPRGPVIARTPVRVAAGRAHVVAVPLRAQGRIALSGRRLAQGHADRDRPRQARQRRHARPQRRAARLARSSSVTRPPPHPGYRARMRRLLIALALLLARTARDGLGGTRASASRTTRS